MTQIYRLESASNNPQNAGILFVFPSGTRKSVQWCTKTRVADTKALAAKAAAAVRAALMDAGLHDDLDRTNWVSAVAACDKHIRDANSKLEPATL